MTEKRRRTRKSKLGKNREEDGRFEGQKKLFQTSCTMFLIFYAKFISVKSYIYVNGGLRVILEIQAG